MSADSTNSFFSPPLENPVGIRLEFYKLGPEPIVRNGVISPLQICYKWPKINAVTAWGYNPNQIIGAITLFITGFWAHLVGETASTILIQSQHQTALVTEDFWDASFGESEICRFFADRMPEGINVRWGAVKLGGNPYKKPNDITRWAPDPEINGVISYISRVITPVTHL